MPDPTKMQLARDLEKIKHKIQDLLYATEDMLISNKDINILHKAQSGWLFTMRSLLEYEPEEYDYVAIPAYTLQDTIEDLVLSANKKE